jgi:hypothetical protein
MRPVYVWDKDSQKARDFAEKWDCEVVERYDAMVGKVDAVLVGDLILAPWQHLLLRPYIQAGIPSFLQRHWSDSLVHMDEMLDLAARHSTPVMATVPFEHYDEANIAGLQLNTAGEVLGAFATAEIPDEPHFHIPYLMMKILGYDVGSISMNTDDVRKTGFLSVDYFYPGTDQRKPFVLSMQGAGTDLFSFNIICKQRMDGRLIDNRPIGAVVRRLEKSLPVPFVPAAILRPDQQRSISARQKRGHHIT